MRIQHSRFSVVIAAMTASLFSFFLVSFSCAEEYKSRIVWKEPVVVTPGETTIDPASDAVVLFREPKDIDNWKNGQKWKVEDDNLVVGDGSIISKATFGDCQVHISGLHPSNAWAGEKSRRWATADYS